MMGRLQVWFDEDNPPTGEAQSFRPGVAHALKHLLPCAAAATYARDLGTEIQER